MNTKEKMSDTPRTDTALQSWEIMDLSLNHKFIELRGFARSLERELNEALAKLESYSDDCAMMDSLRQRLGELQHSLGACEHVRLIEQLTAYKAMCERLAHVVRGTNPFAELALDSYSNKLVVETLNDHNQLKKQYDT